MTDRAVRPGGFLTSQEKETVKNAIIAAEKTTSAEIQVLISKTVRGDALAAAKERFAKLGMHKTAQRNGVLILLAVKSRTFAIYGDEGIHAHFGQEGWDHLRDGMVERFKNDDFGGGLTYAVTEVGKTLAEKFPHQAGDVNELSNEVLEE